MLEILKKLQNLEAEEENVSEDSEDELMEKLASLDLEKTSTAELEALLGPKQMDKFQEMLSNGVPSDWLKEGQLAVIDPWFLCYQPGIVLDEPVPDFIPKLWTETLPSLESVENSDFWWNDLVEVCIIYTFLHLQYDESEFADLEILNEEIIPVTLGLSSVLCSTSPETFTYTSAPEAIEAAKASIFMNCAETIDFKQDLLPGCRAILSHPSQLQRMLADMARWFYKRRRPDEFFAGKRLLYLLSWFTKESSSSTAKELLKFLTSILELGEAEEKEE